MPFTEEGSPKLDCCEQMESHQDLFPTEEIKYLVHKSYKDEKYVRIHAPDYGVWIPSRAETGF